ncbi:hypothetical protein [Flavobacterium beibuense]|uniref:hypothetical protein n=1 Tax=Flavobacterium beibuense TaxID=657326 RepID=UPI003A8EFAFE
MKKFLTLFLFFGMVTTIYAERCGCGTKASGLTIEYDVHGSGINGSNCCTFGYAIFLEETPPVSMTWRDNGNGTYTMTSATAYANADEAQKDCCPDLQG